MMKEITVKKTAALGLCSVLLLAACGSDEEPEGQPTPEETQTSEENTGPGAGAITETVEPSEPGGSEESEQAQEQTVPDEPEPSRTIDIEDEDPRDTDSEGVESDPDAAEAAYRRAEDASATAAEQNDPSQWRMPDDESEINDEVGTGWWVEREEEASGLFGETVADYRPAEDFNRDEAFVRASYLLHETSRPGSDDVGEYPETDEAWESAAECNAESEVHTEHEADDEEHSHTPDFTLFVEYRWVDGDQGCDLTQPDEFYEYQLILDDSGLLTINNRTVRDEALMDRPSGWE